MLLLLVLIAEIIIAQENINQKPINKYVKFCSKEINKCNTKTIKKNKKFIKKYFRIENRLFRKMCKSNSDLADYYFSYAVNPFFYHQNNPEEYLTQNQKELPIEYNSTLDTLKNSVLFLELNKDTSSEVNKLNYSNALVKLNESNRLSKETSLIQSHFRERKLILKSCTTKHPAFKNEWVKYDKTNYYFNEFTNKIDQHFINNVRNNEFADNILSINKEFRDFISKNSLLKNIHSIPSDWGNDIGSRQTNAFTKSVVNNTISSIKNSDQLIKDEIEPMHETINKLKNSTGITNAADAPSFKPNPIKSKTFSERLDFDFDFQINKSNDFYPLNISLGGTIAYHLSNHFIVGTGMTNLISLGEGWDNRQFKPMENGCRLYIDYLINKSLFAEFSSEKSFKNKIYRIENNYSKNLFFDTYMSGLKYVKRVSEKLSLTFTLLYIIQSSPLSPSKGPLVYRVGWQF